MFNWKFRKCTFENVVNYVILFALLLLIVFLKVAFIKTALGPSVMPDEAGFLENARRIFVGGYNSSEYPLGYSLLLGLAVVIGKTPIDQYKLSLETNLIIWLIFSAFLLNFYKRLIKTDFWAIVFFILTISFPAMVVYGGFVLSENIFIWVQLVYLLVIYRLIEKGKIPFGWWLLFAVIVFYSFLVRGNGVINLPVAILAIWIFLKGGVRGKLIISSGVIVIFLLFYKILEHVNGFLLGPGLGPPSGIDMSAMLNLSMFGVVFIKKFIIVIFGHFFYINYATFGLVSFLISLFVFLRSDIVIWAKEDANRKILLFFGYSFFLFFLNLLFSSFYMAREGFRGDHFIYGRYVEGYILVLFVPSFAFLYKFFSSYRLDNMGNSVRMVLFVLVLNIVSFFVSKLSGWTEIELNTMNITSMQPIAVIVGQKEIFLVILSLYFLILFMLIKTNQKFALLVVFIIFLARSVIFYKTFYLLGNVARSREREIANYINAKPYKVDKICYDRETWSAWHYFNYKFFLPKTIFVRYTSSEEFYWDCPWIISGRMDLVKDYPNAELLTIENHANQALWVNNLENRNIYNAINVKNIGKKFEPENYRSKIEMVSIREMVFDTGRDIEVILKVKNLGKQRWFNLFSIKRGEGGVRVGVVGDTGKNIVSLVGGRCDLQKILDPNEESLVYCYFIRNSELSGETYVGLVQEGVGWFNDRGDNLYKIKIPPIKNRVLYRMDQYIKRISRRLGIVMSF